MSSINFSYSTQNEPFGPTNAGDISPDDTKALELLFEPNNGMNDKFRDRPTIIVGRRGSGKTHYLRSVIFDQQYNYCVEIRTPRVLKYVAEIVQRISESENIFFSETIAEVWETILWVVIFSEVRKHSLLSPDDLSLINLYLSSNGIKEDDDVDKVLLAIANTLSERMNQKRGETISEPNRKFENITFDDAKIAVVRNLELSEKNFVIFIDFLDNFQLDIFSVKSALQGFLMIVGSMNKPRDVVDIRFCMPSELYQKFIKLSLNPNKDFRRVLILQWNESDLVLIGARRLMFYLASSHPEFYKKFISLDLKTYAESLILFYAVLPKQINNQVGYQEETLLYILRHTQLLPRHFLAFLNSIFKNSKGGQRANPFPISEERIISGVRQIEGIIVREIFMAFMLIYPTAEETCRRCLPELEYRFTMDDLQSVFTNHGKAVFGSDIFFEFRRMLLEIGAIGRVVPSKARDIYIKGNFEYAVQHQLYPNQDDELCIHPLFSDIFHGSRKQERPVYPNGGVLVDEDNRDNNAEKKTSQKSNDYSYSPLNMVKEKRLKKIFISYRRDDSADVAGRIYDRLVRSFDKKSVFKDVDSIPAGLDFRDVLYDAVKKSDVFLVIIGSQWLELKNANGNRRIDDPGDFVRMEIESALKLNIPVIPILVQGASMPSANKLPRVIKELAYRNGLQVRPDPDFHKDMDRLIGKL